MPLFRRRSDVDKLVAEAVEKALQPYIANAANHQAGVTQGIPSGQFATQTAGNAAAVALPRDGSHFDSGFGPGYPLVPDAIDPVGPNGRAAPRRSQYPVAWNLQLVDRQVPWTVLKGLAEEVDVVSRCIEIKQDEMCGYDWSWGFSPQIIQQIMAETGETNSARATALAREKYGDDLDRVNAFFEMPDKDMNQTFSDWLQALLWDHFVYDGVAIYPSYNLDGTLRALELIDSSTIKLLRDNRGRIPSPPAPAYQQILYGFPRGEFQHQEDADDEFRLDQLAYYIKRPRNTSVYGFPVVEETMALSTTYLARQAWMRAEYQSGVIPKMMWEIPPNFNWTPEQMAYHEQAFNDRLQGQTQRRQMAFFAPGKPTFAPSMDEHYKQDYDAFLIVQIGTRFGVTASQLGIADKSALRGSNVEEENEQSQMYGSKALINWVVDILNDLARKYLGIGPEITLTNNGNETAEDSLSIVQADATDVGAGIATRNEIRAKRGLPLIDLPEADQLGVTIGTGVEFLTGTLKAQEDGQTITGNMAATGAKPGGEPVGHPAGTPAGTAAQPAADEQDQAAMLADSLDDIEGDPKSAAKKAERAAYARFMAKGTRDREFVWHHHTAAEVTVIKAETSPKGVEGAERLARYWTEGEGAAKVSWGHDGDYDRCRVELAKHVPPEDVDGLCANYHHRATGAWPGHAPGESHAKAADPKAIAWADHPGHKFADAIVAHFAPQIAAALTDGTEGLHAAISTARGVLGKAIAPEPPVAAAPVAPAGPNLMLVETMQAAQAAVAQAVQIDTTQLAATLTQLYANAGLTGSHAAATVTGGPVLTELASLEATVNWDTWEPGDKVAADVVRHAGLQQLLADQDATIKGIVDSALDRLSTSLANSIEAGDNMATTAKAMRDVIADPKRAYVIANTETARAMSASSIATYAANGVAEWDWLAEPDACPVCLKNEADSPYDVGEGPTVPAHPNCRCAPTPHVEVPDGH